VRNLPDGRVQLEAEGTAREVAAFVEAVVEHLETYIRKTERSSSRRPAQFAGFTIR
jgi:acylphosphatase